MEIEQTMDVTEDLLLLAVQGSVRRVGEITSTPISNGGAQDGMGTYRTVSDGKCLIMSPMVLSLPPGVTSTAVIANAV